MTAPAVPSPGSVRALAVLAAGVFLAALDQTVVVTVLYKVQQDFQIPATEFDQLAWVVTAYLLGYTVTLPLLGRVADVWGRKRLFLAGLGVFLIGSVLAALAPDLRGLIAARVVQAVGGGALLPIGMAMTRGLPIRGGRTFALGLLGATAEAGGVLGPLWGALIVQALDWRWIFWLNLPLGALIAVALRWVPAQPRLREALDWFGAALLSGALLALTLGLAATSSTGSLAGLRLSTPGAVGSAPPAWLPWVLGGVAVVLLIAFLVREQRAPAPLVPLAWFRRLPFGLAHLTNFAVGCALIVAMVNVPLLVDSVRNGSAADGGLMLLRMGDRVLTAAGLACTGAGLLLMSRWAATEAEWVMTLDLAIAGLGFGLVIAPIVATVLHWVSEPQAAVAAALINTARMVGAMLGLSLLAGWGLELFKSLMAPYPATDYIDKPQEYEALVRAAGLQVYTTGFLVAGLLCLVAILPALGLRRPAPPLAAAIAAAGPPPGEPAS